MTDFNDYERGSSGDYSKFPNVQPIVESVKLDEDADHQRWQGTQRTLNAMFNKDELNKDLI